MFIQGSVSEEIRESLIDAIVTDPTRNFAWYYNDSVASMRNEHKSYGGFTHTFCVDNTVNSAYYNLSDNLLKYICNKENINFSFVKRSHSFVLCNIKVTKKEHNSSIHRDMQLTDLDFKYISILYYVNDSDGDTLFYDENKNIINRVSPLSGNYVIFDSTKLHSATPPTNHKTRYIINYILGTENI
jgi:hypothetical protein